MHGKPSTKERKLDHVHKCCCHLLGKDTDFTALLQRVEEIAKKLSSNFYKGSGKKNKTFANLVQIVDNAVNNFIIRNEELRSTSPKPTTEYVFKFKVDAIPLSYAEIRHLLWHIEHKYIDRVYGNCFAIKKRLFSKKYIIYSTYCEHKDYKTRCRGFSMTPPY